MADDFFDAIRNLPYDPTRRLAREFLSEEAGLYGQQGIKGPIGSRGVKNGPGRPQWIQDIIDFRNEKYFEDVGKYGGEETDRKYDKIDSAIFKLEEGIKYDDAPTYKNRYQLLKESKEV